MRPRYLASDQTPTQDSVQDLSSQILIVLSLLLLAVIGGHCLRRCHSKYLQEAGLTTIIGVVAGIVLNYILGDKKDVNEIEKDFFNIFILVLLPPIIFESGYNLKRRIFFTNFGSILMFAFVGTGIAIVVTTILIYLITLTGLSTPLTLKESFAYGVLISATDPVSVLATFKEIKADQNLYSLIFGESIFNDAVTLVLYDTIVNQNGDQSLVSTFFESTGLFFGKFLGSLVVGIVSALVVALILKKQYAIVQNIHNVEIITTLMTPYVTYLISERFNLSGIVSILTNGIFLAHYGTPNVSTSSRRVLRHAFEMAAYATETLVFIFLGMGIFAFNTHIDWLVFGLFVTVALSTQVGRIFNLWLVSCCINKARTNKVTGQFKCVMLLSGLRGAIAFALSLKSVLDFPKAEGGHGEEILTTTILFALMTILLLGSMISPFLSRVKSLPEANEMPERLVYLRCQCCERLKDYIARCDEKYFLPFFLREEAIERRAQRGEEDSETNSSFSHHEKNQNNFGLDTGDTRRNNHPSSGEIEMRVSDTKDDEIFK